MLAHHHHHRRNVAAAIFAFLLVCFWSLGVHAGCSYQGGYFSPLKPAPGDPFSVYVGVLWTRDTTPCIFLLGYNDAWASWDVSNAEVWTEEYAPYFSCSEYQCTSFGAATGEVIAMFVTKRFQVPLNANQPPPALLYSSNDGEFSLTLSGLSPGFALEGSFPSPNPNYVPGSNYAFTGRVKNNGPFAVDGRVDCVFRFGPVQALDGRKGTLAPPSGVCGAPNGLGEVACSFTGVVNVNAFYNFAFSINNIKGDFRETITMDILGCTATNGKNLAFVEPQLVSIQPQLVTDLELVTLGTSATEILAGRTAQLSFRVTNHGPSDSFDSSCLWVFPSDLTLLSRDINEGCSASVSGASTNVNCNMDLLVGNKDRNLLLQLDSSTALSTVEYSMACTDEAGAQGDSFGGLLTVRTFAEELRVQLNWLNPVAEREELRRLEGGDVVEYEIIMTSGGPSWARDVACAFNFTRIDFYLANPEEQTFYLDSANFTCSLPTGACSEVGSPSSSPTKTVVCLIDEVGVETSTTFNFELSTAEPLANLSVSISCQSETTPNNFAPISWEAYYDVVNGKVRYTIVPPPEDSSSASSVASSSASSSASSEQSEKSASSSSASSEQSSSTVTDDAKARTEEEESVGEKPEFIAGLTVGLLLFLLLVAVVIALVVLRRRRLLTKQKRINQAEMEMGDVAEYGFKEDAADVEQGEKGRGEAASKTGITWEIPFGDLEFEEEIGRGAFGVVWRGAWRDSEVAIKQLNITQSKQIDSFKAEAELMKRLRPHSNVVLLLGVCTEEHHPFCLVTEYLPEGNLRSFLRGKKGRKLMKDKKAFLRMAREIAAGMNHLHSEGITHRDLACRNLLLASNLSIKVADFGLACEHEDVSNLEEFAADSPLPLKWIAPECLRSHVYSSKADVWSYGVTLWEMANGGADPYPGMTAFEAATSVYDGGSPDIPSTAPQVIQDIMTLCFSHDPDERPTFKDILQQLKNVK